MGKEIRGGIIVGVAVLVAAIVYSAVYFQQGFIRFDQGGSSVLLVLLWTLVVAVLLVVLWQRMLVREEYLRKFYLSSDAVFNFELGCTPLSEALASQDSAALVAYLRAALAGLTYNDAPQAPPANFKPTLCVSTRRFNKASDSGEWLGSLQRIQQRDDGHRTFVEVATFANAEELQHALEKHAVIASSS